ncbi:MAG: hypothetical protein RL112_722 [Planctomycetota bacterium]|jgi:flagellar hook-basal body complex protein FliE
MVDGIGDRSGLARAAIEAALKRHSEALGRADGAAKPASGPGEAQGAFAPSLGEAIRSVDQTVKSGDQLVDQVLSGQVSDFHEAASKLKEAELGLRFALEVRNKFVDAYREVMRMSV